MIKLPATLTALLLASTAHAAGVSTLKREAIAGVEARAKLAQQMNDKIFSFGELGFQEVETSKYITSVLEQNGFTVTRGVAGLPTGWVATWTNKTGGPTIAFGSDIDGIPKASQMPGLPYRQPMVPGAPGHGEGHNSGNAVNVVAALAVKDIMAKQGIAGTLMLWPGVAEELVAGKAYMVRDGVFKNVDAVLFTHVGDNLVTSWGPSEGTGSVSVKYTFHGQSAHAAGAPWKGKSALDGVELMNIGWEFHREHVRPEQRSHYVITDGGDQPNVVPQIASTWYYFREQSFKRDRRPLRRRQPHRRRCRADDRHHGRARGARHRRAAPLQQADRAGDVRQYPGGRPAQVVSPTNRPSPRPSRPRSSPRRPRGWRPSSTRWRRPPRTPRAAAPTTSATSRGRCRR